MRNGPDNVRTRWESYRVREKEMLGHRGKSRARSKRADIAILSENKQGEREIDRHRYLWRHQLKTFKTNDKVRKLVSLKVPYEELRPFRRDLRELHLDFLIWNWNSISASICKEIMDKNRNEGEDLGGNSMLWTIEHWAKHRETTRWVPIVTFLIVYWGVWILKLLSLPEILEMFDSEVIWRAHKAA